MVLRHCPVPVADPAANGACLCRLGRAEATLDCEGFAKAVKFVPSVKAHSRGPRSRSMNPVSERLGDDALPGVLTARKDISNARPGSTAGQPAFRSVICTDLRLRDRKRQVRKTPLGLDWPVFLRTRRNKAVLALRARAMYQVRCRHIPTCVTPMPGIACTEAAGRRAVRSAGRTGQPGHPAPDRAGGPGRHAACAGAVAAQTR
jgi:hypothetical protein